MLPIVPMFHVNAWGLPFGCIFFGANQVFAGPFMDPKSVLELLVNEKVTVTGGVPTVWLGVLNELEANPGKYDLGHLRVILVGGSAAPISMIRAFQERYHVPIMHAWGMTEMSPVARSALPSSLRTAPSGPSAQRAKQGIPVPLVEIRGRSEKGLFPVGRPDHGRARSAGSVGGVRVTSTCPVPTIASRKTAGSEPVTSSPSRGRLHRDRRSQQGSGEVRRQMDQFSGARNRADGSSGRGRSRRDRGAASQVGRAAACCRGAEARTQSDRRGAHRIPRTDFAKWWLPDVIEFVGEIPRTSVGKFKKSALREQFKDRYQPTT